MDVSLVMFKADGVRREFPVTKNRVVIGRVNSCDLRVPLSSVSRQHCELKIVRGAVKINDLGASNGTYVNGSRVGLEKALHPGDRIQVGPIIFTLVIDGVPATDSPTDTLMEAQVEAERKTGDAVSRAGDDKPQAPPPKKKVAAKVAGPEAPTADADDLDELLDDIGNELLHMSNGNESAAPIILPDDDEQEEPAPEAKQPPAAEKPPAKAAAPEAEGSSVLEEFDDLMEGIEDQISGEDEALPTLDDDDDETVEQLTDDDLVEQVPEAEEDEIVGEVDQEAEEELAELDDDDEAAEPESEPEPAPAPESAKPKAAVDDDPVAALEAMADGDAPADDGIDISWLADDEPQNK